MNELYFDDIIMLEFVKSKIASHFKDKKWLKLFGQELIITQSSEEVLATFPVVDIQIVGISATGSVINATQYITSFTLQIEVYTKNVTNMNREKLASKIMNEIIVIIQGFGRKNRLSSNRVVPSQIEETTRRMTTIDCRYNNQTRQFD